MRPWTIDRDDDGQPIRLLWTGHRASVTPRRRRRRLPAPPAVTCAFGLPWNVHVNGHGCLWCAAESDRLAAQFAADVASGKYDAFGYTPTDRRAQHRKVISHE